MIHQIWEQFLAIIKEEAGSHVVDTWFKAVSLNQWDPTAKQVCLEVPNSFVRDWIKTHYMLLLSTHLSRLFNTQNVKIHFILQGEQAEPTLLTPAVVATVDIHTSDHAQKKEFTTVVPFKKTPTIHSAHTFHTFVIGPHNSLACAAANAVAEKPGVLYNPLFFYGDSGLGKTHLLHAIGNMIKERDPKAVILYQTADRFVNEFIHAIRFDKIHKFKEKYRSVDVLLIDDIQFISNKEQTQEAFFHIFNSLYDMHKQIVFSSDAVPQDIQGLAERLRSRLAWGLVADIRAPELETKIAILKKKAEMSGCRLDDAVAHYIASRDISNIRELEGSLVRVMAFASLTNQQLTLELAQRVLHKTTATKTLIVDFDNVIKCIKHYYPYSLDDLRSKTRSKELSQARHVAMYMMKKMTGKSLRDIGVFLGGRDHSTVMHALTKVELESKNNNEFLAQLKQIEQDIIQLTK